MEKKDAEFGPGWLQLPASSSQSDKRQRGRTWGGGGGTCHECRKSNATKGPLFVSESCQAILRGGRKHSYHLACLSREYATLADSELCPACAGACVCLGGPKAHPCKVSLRPSASGVRERSKASKLPGTEVTSCEQSSDQTDSQQTEAVPSVGDQISEIQRLRRSLRTAGTYRSYALEDDTDDVPDLERSDSIVSSLISSSDSLSAGSADAFRAAAAAVAPGWAFAAAQVSQPGSSTSFPLFCFSKTDYGADAVVPSGESVCLPSLDAVPQLSSQKAPDALDDMDLSPALVKMLNEIAPRSVLEMCLGDPQHGSVQPEPEQAHKPQIRVSHQQPWIPGVSSYMTSFPLPAVNVSFPINNYSFPPWGGATESGMSSIHVPSYWRQ